MSFVETFSSSSEVQNVLKLYGNQLFGTLKSALCREVYYIMFICLRVHYHYKGNVSTRSLYVLSMVFQHFMHNISLILF